MVVKFAKTSKLFPDCILCRQFFPIVILSDLISNERKVFVWVIFLQYLIWVSEFKGI